MILASLAQVGQQAIALALVIAVSRILSPNAVGVFLMAYTVVLLVLPLRDFQIQSFVIQRETIDEAIMGAVSFAAWTSALASLAACLAGVLAFSLVFPGSGIAECLLIMTIACLIRPFSLTASALLAREQHYGPLAAIKLAAALARAAVTLGLLALGQGPEALAWGLIAENLVELAAIALVPRAMRLPRPRASGSGEVFAFSAPLAGSHLVITLSTALTPLLIGGYQGLAMTAFFNRARTVSQFFRSIIEIGVQPIVLSEFARTRGDLAELRQTFLKATGLLTAVTWPALAWLIASATPLSVALFGAEWAEVAPLAQLLALGAIVYSATALSQQLHAALGQSKLLMLREGLLQLPLLAIILIAAPISTLAVTGGIALTALLSFAVNMALLARNLDLALSQLARATWKSGTVAALTGLVACAVLQIPVVSFNSAQTLALLLVAGALSWLASLAALRHPLLEEGRRSWASLTERPIDRPGA